MPNVNIKTENREARESRPSDVRAARELTEFIRRNVMMEANAHLMSQVNSLSRLALSLLG
jgi:flagellin